MAEERLSGLAMMKIHRRRANELNLDTLVTTFVNRHPRRMLLLCVLSYCKCVSYNNISAIYAPLFAVIAYRYYSKKPTFGSFSRVGAVGGPRCVLSIMMNVTELI